MAIAQNGSAITATSTTTVATTASITPSAGDLMIALCSVTNVLGATGLKAAAVTDSIGSTWTLEKLQQLTGDATTAIYSLDAGASPSARTVTLTGTVGSTGITVVRFSGAAAVADQVGATAGAVGLPYSLSITTKATGSQVVGALARGTNNQATTVNGSTTNYSVVNVNSDIAASFYATALTSTPGAITLGYSTTASANNAIALYEIIPFGWTPPALTDIAFDVSTVGVDYVSTGTQTTSHAAAATARAAVVMIDQNGTASDEVSGVTYGGTAMTRLAFNTEATEAGGNYIYWLDNIAGGTQNVAMTTTAATSKQVVAATMRVAPGASVAVAGNNTGTSASVANPSWTISGLTAGIALEAFEVIHSGLTTMTTTPAASWNLISSTDLGAAGRGFAYQDIASSGTTLTCGWTAVTADDFVGSSVAFYQVAAPAVVHELIRPLQQAVNRSYFF